MDNDRQKPGRTGKDVGRRLKLARLAMGYTEYGDQAAFARNAGVKVATYSNYEQGISFPDRENACNLYDAYGITLDWVILGKPEGLPAHLRNGIERLSKLDLD